MRALVWINADGSWKRRKKCLASRNLEWIMPRLAYRYRNLIIEETIVAGIWKVCAPNGYVERKSKLVRFMPVIFLIKLKWTFFHMNSRMAKNIPCVYMSRMPPSIQTRRSTRRLAQWLTLYWPKESRQPS
jgi:hypothetical protein